MTQTLETKTTVDRLKIYKTSPELYDAMMALSNAAAKDIDAELGELIKIRASQINHCTYCLDMHTRDARKHGVSEQKLDVLAAWAEADGLFTERERAALALTEASLMTFMQGPQRFSLIASWGRSSRWRSRSMRGTVST